MLMHQPPFPGSGTTACCTVGTSSQLRPCRVASRSAFWLGQGFVDVRCILGDPPWSSPCTSFALLQSRTTWAVLEHFWLSPICARACGLLPPGRSTETSYYWRWNCGQRCPPTCPASHASYWIASRHTSAPSGYQGLSHSRRQQL